MPKTFKAEIFLLTKGQMTLYYDDTEIYNSAVVFLAQLF